MKKSKIFLIVAIFLITKPNSDSIKKYGNNLCLYSWKNIYLVDSNGVKFQMKDGDRLGYHLIQIYVDKNDSTYLQFLPAFGNNSDTTLSSSDGGFYFGKGKATIKSNTLFIKGKWVGSYYGGIQDSSIEYVLEKHKSEYILKGKEAVIFLKYKSCASKIKFFNAWTKNKRYNGLE